MDASSARAKAAAFPQASCGKRKPAETQIRPTAIVKKDNEDTEVNRSCLFCLPLLFCGLGVHPLNGMTLTRAPGKNEVKVSSQFAAGAVAIVADNAAASIYCDPHDVQPTAIAVGMLADDVRKVTGQTPRVVDRPDVLSGDAVIVGTIGHSAAVDRLIANGRIGDVDKIRGRWEHYLLQVIEQPLPNVRRALVIVGSDRRGTAYGVLTLSEAIGVSPWYWWADVPITKKSSLFVQPGLVKDGPVIRYRGIFLNDEAPCLSGWTKAKFSGFNSRFYAHVFELLLRLKANYLWPAMWGNAFNEDDPRNAKLANDYGIVMGTSHQEPMLRAQAEFDHRYRPAEWNYATHPALLQQFWREGIRRNKDFESVITIGMRGRDDTPMIEGATAEQSMALLEKIVAEQRKILADEMNPRVEQVPQLWCLYKEVQGYYELGLRVPDDVTLLWSDDNWGNLRRLPTPEERNRRGGAGIYYHFDYVGGPRSYKWLNTNPVAKVWEQMNLAYHYDANRVWIVNVGDLKPMEFPIEFFLTMAWDPGRLPKERIEEFTRRWAAREFGQAHADEIADIFSKYTKYNGRRKPELVDPSTFSLVNYDEADRVVGEWRAITSKAEEIYRTLPDDSRDAFYQLVLYPTKASAIVTEMYVAAAKNRLYAAQRRAAANDFADQTRTLFSLDKELSDYYNHKLAGGKWLHMMDQTHIGYTGWRDPVKNAMPEVEEIEVPPAASMGVAVEGSSSAWPGSEGQAVLPLFDALNQQRRRIEVFNRGRAPFDFTATSSAPWVMLSAASGVVEKERQLWVSVDWSKAPQGEAEAELRLVGAAPAFATGEPVTVKVRAFNPPEPAQQSLRGFVGADGCVSIDAEHFTGKHDTADARWEKIDDYGRTCSAMSVFPVTAASIKPPQDAPFLEYRIYLFDAGKVDLEAIVAPALNFVPGRGLRYAVSFDGEPAQIVDLLARNSTHDWETAVKDNARRSHSSHTIAKPGYHTLQFRMVDPGVVLEKLIVSFGAVRASYLGPPESHNTVGQPTPTVAPLESPTTLRQAADGRLLVGTAAMSDQLEDPKLAALVADQFNCVTPENEMKPEFIQPAPGEFEFAPADRIVAFAQSHGMKVVGHTLCWHNQTPEWLYRDRQNRPLPRAEALQNLRAHITTVVGHFKGKVLGWDVVNEALGDGPGDYLRDTPARRAIGDDYIAKAFEFAHAADPDAELYYNDYGNENPAKRDKTIRLVRELSAKGIRIDGVGIQGHFALSDSSAPQRLDKAIAVYAAAGVKVAITELDVDVLPRAAHSADLSEREQGARDPYRGGLPSEVATAQAEFYRRVFAVAVKHRATVTRITLWGTHDGTSWLNEWPSLGRTNHPLLWTRTLNPKPALQAALEALAR
jgi:GH35 family endo-1,4-beta-xylanase